ncbi:hypothetical protein Taro_018639 [Colocasia esculenta]|uniref:Uncharacterized protein n=1 Tax=Colocasia esculenta TaxID=4460 RepID=A0A843V327_COLES|nr:hypothetical protein [Colocasia esculenta]
MQKIRRSAKVRQVWVPKKEAQKIENTQANTSEVVGRRSDAKCTSLQHVESKRLNGQKRKGMYRKSNYIPQDPENIQNFRLGRVSFKRHTYMSTKIYPHGVSLNVRE